MKKLLVIVLAVFLTGCSTTTIPNYIKDHNPYKKTFYGEYKDVLDAVNQSIMDLGWAVTTTADPAIYETSKSLDDANARQLLLFTDIKQNLYFVGTRYQRLNTYVRTGNDNAVEVELRFVRVHSMPFKNFYKYKNDRLADKFFRLAESNLN